MYPAKEMKPTTRVFMIERENGTKADESVICILHGFSICPLIMHNAALRLLRYPRRMRSLGG